MTADDARLRFDTATARHLSAPLADGVTIRAVTAEGWTALTDPLWASEDPRPGIALEPLFTPAHATEARDLAAVLGTPLEHRLVFEHDGELVGAYFGQQDTFGRYAMTTSVFGAAWRGRGLYRALLHRVVAAAKAAGFREIYSRHRADNNAILVPKLRAGFVIAGFEIAPRWGLLVHLRRYLVDEIALVHAHRIDGARQDELRALGVLPP